MNVGWVCDGGGHEAEACRAGPRRVTCKDSPRQQGHYPARVAAPSLVERGNPPSFRQNGSSELFRGIDSAVCTKFNVPAPIGCGGMGNCPIQPIANVGKRCEIECSQAPMESVPGSLFWEQRARFTIFTR